MLAEAPSRPLTDDELASLVALAETMVSERRFDEARRIRAIMSEQQLDRTSILVATGNVLREIGRPEEARVLLSRALSRDPRDAPAWTALASIMSDLRRYDDAVAAYSNALKIDASLAPALVGLGVTLRKRGLPQHAITFFDMAVTLDPANAQAHYCRALAMLAAGNYEQGFAEHEWRWLTGARAGQAVNGQRWAGEALEGRTLLVCEEGGISDLLQFARYLPCVASAGGRVLLRAPIVLLPVLSRVAGVHAVTPSGVETPPYDLVCPIMSLPVMFGTTLQSIPSSDRYLTPDPARVGIWRDRLATDARRSGRPSLLRVGLVWKGDPYVSDRETAIEDDESSASLETFDPLADVAPSILFYSLQLGRAAAETADPPPGMRVINHTDLIRDYDDIVALVSLLDLVVSVDSPIVHLAGALGQPVWLLSSYERSWRWLNDREDSPWYDSLRLYTQPAPGDWATPVDRIVADLSRLARRETHPAPAAPAPSDRHASARSVLAQALIRQEEGDLRAASNLYTNAIELDPSLVEAHNNLGNVLRQLGKLDRARLCFETAIALSPEFSAPHYNLGSLHADTGNLDLAVECLNRAVKLNPAFPHAHFNLANVLTRLKRYDDAVDAFRDAVRIDPVYAEAHNNLGHTFMQMGRTAEAMASFTEALLLKPDFADAYVNQGCAFLERHELDEAIGCFGEALAIDPDLRQAHNNLGSALQEQGRLQEASVAFANAIRVKADYTVAYINLGDTLCQLKQFKEAEVCLRHAIELEPDNAHAHGGLGTVLAEQGKIGLAIASYRQALAFDPAKTEVHNDLGNVLKDQGRLAEASAHYARALQLRPDYLTAFSNHLFTLNYLQTQSPAAACAEARRYGALVSSRATPFTSWRSRSPGQPLRVGLVSSDLRSHPVGYFLETLLASIDPARVTLLAFPSQKSDDDLTARIKPHFAAWTALVGLSDEAAARLIHALGVDVLIDLSGHTANNRLPVFAWRPAPVQVSWLGYFATTGLAEIDYVIADHNVARPGEEAHFTETIWRLPEIYYCFSPPAFRVEVASLPSLSAGHITFGCFNNLTKLNDTVVAVWSRILHAVPGSRLMLKAPQLRDEGMCESTRDRFAALGITADRLLLEPPSWRADYLAAYGRIDIALDPFPYPGGTTTCEALWMGAPVLTRRGDRFLSHAGETILRNAGLPDWIASDDDDYVARAVRFAAEVDQLAGLRARLRNQVLASPLFDAPRFANSWAIALTEMWRRHQNGDEHRTAKS